MKYKQFIWILVFLFIELVSCNKKDAYMGYTPGKGAPSITSVHTLSKTLYNDTVVTTSESYDTLGNLTTSLDSTIGNSTTGFDSVTDEGSLGNYYVIHGKNLGAATGVYFNGVQAYFNRSLGTDQTIIVQIPTTGIPTSGPLATDTLTVTTLYGTAKYHFVVLAPPPTINATSDYDFTNGSQITLTGVGFANVSSVSLKGVSTSSVSSGQFANNIKIISQNDSVMTLEFGATSITQGYLVFAYTQGNGTTDSSTSTAVFNNIDNAYQIYTDNTQNGWGSWSWGTVGTSTTTIKDGTTSFFTTFGAGNWSINGFRQGGGSATDGVPYSDGYQYLSFWVKGGTMSETVYIEWGNESFGNANPDNEINAITILPSTWQFFKIAIPTLLWNTGKTSWNSNSSQLLNTIGFFLPRNTVDETFYFDNIVLIK